MTYLAFGAVEAVEVPMSRQAWAGRGSTRNGVESRRQNANRL